MNSIISLSKTWYKTASLYTLLSLYFAFSDEQSPHINNYTNTLTATNQSTSHHVSHGQAALPYRLKGPEIPLHARFDLRAVALLRHCPTRHLHLPHGTMLPEVHWAQFSTERRTTVCIIRYRQDFWHNAVGGAAQNAPLGTF